MTLPASGAISGADIRNELRQSGGSLVFPDATTRWLSDKPTGSIVIPTDLHSKAAVKRTQLDLTVGSGTNFSTLVNLGPVFPNRRLVVCIACVATSNASQILINSATLGGVGLTSGPGQAWFNPSYNISSGIFTGAVGAIGGTSATLAVNFNQSCNTMRAVVYSVANIGTILDSDQGGSASATSASTAVAVSANGVIIASGLKCGSAASMDFIGVNEDTDINMTALVRYGTGFQNRLSSDTSRTIGITASGSANICTTAAISFD